MREGEIRDTKKRSDSSKKKNQSPYLDEWMVLFSADEWTDESSEIKVNLSYTILFIPGDVLVVPIFLYIYVYSPDF